MEMFRKIAAILIGIMVALFTIIAILGIWDIIEVQHLFTKSMKTLAVLFVSSAILMFIFSVLFKETDKVDSNKG